MSLQVFVISLQLNLETKTPGKKDRWPTKTTLGQDNLFISHVEWPENEDHLSTKTTYFWSQGWSSFPGFTVLLWETKWFYIHRSVRNVVSNYPTIWMLFKKWKNCSKRKLTFITFRTLVRLLPSVTMPMSLERDHTIPSIEEWCPHCLHQTRERICVWERERKKRERKRERKNTYFCHI